MLNFPAVPRRDEFIVIIIQYAEMFSKPVFAHVKLLLAGAILAPGKRNISSVLHILGLSQEKKFHKYHRVLSLAKWSALQAARILLSQLLSCLLPEGPIVLGIAVPRRDETLERRWGSKITKIGPPKRRHLQRWYA
jgi:hypothetical protein